MRSPFSALAAALVLSHAAAQTFVVDAANRPGTNFTSLAAAVAAAPDGALLLVRGGFYVETFAITGKGLSILCDPAASLSVPLTAPAPRIDNQSASQTVVVSNLRISAHLNNPASVTLACGNARGPIVLSRVEGTQSHGLNLWVQNCDRVHVSGSVLQNDSGRPNVRVENSHAVFASCSLGWNTLAASAAGIPPAVVQRGGTLQLADVAVATGANLMGPGGSAIDTTGGDLRVLGASVLGGGFGTTPGRAIEGTSAVRLDPTVAVTGGPQPLDPRLPVTVQPMPHVLANVSAAGVVTAALRGPANDVGLLFVGLPAPRAVLPFAPDAVWLDQGTMQLQSLGTFSPSAPAVTLQTPPLAGIAPGLTVGFQGASLSASGVQVGNPAFVTLP